MTFFQPEQKSLMNYVIAALILASVGASIMVIWVYNKSVNLGYEISSAETTIKKVQTENSQLQDQIFTLLNSADVSKFANSGSLVEDKNPQYMRISPDLAISQTD